MFTRTASAALVLRQRCEANGEDAGGAAKVQAAPAAGKARPAEQVAATPPATAASDQYLAPVRGARGGRPGQRIRAAFDAVPVPAIRSDVRLLEDNTEAWLAVWRVIREAKTGVDACYFITERDVFGVAFLGALLAKARRGQPVRYMVDAIGELETSGFARRFTGQEYLQELALAGAEVKVHHPIYQKIFGAPGKILASLTGAGVPFGLIGNDHMKFVRNAEMLVGGGRNVSRDYFTPAADRADVFRDTDVLVHGRRASSELERIFLREFEVPGMHHVVRPDLLLPFRRRDVELLGTYLMMDAWLSGVGLSAADKERLRGDPAAREPAAAALVERAAARLAEEGIERMPTERERKALLVRARELVGYPGLEASAPAFRPEEGMHRGVELKLISKTSAAAPRANNDFQQALPAMIRGSDEGVFSRSAYFVVTHNQVETLRQEGARGLPVHILTNSTQSTDSTWTQADFIEHWPHVLAAVPNLRLFVLGSQRKLHCKDALFDERLTLVTSHNLDITSERINSELGFLMWSPTMAEEMRAIRKRDLEDPAQKVLEYTILRDAHGQPVLKDGDPVVTFGAKDHTPPEQWESYKKQRRMLKWVRRLPFVWMLRHPALDV